MYLSAARNKKNASSRPPALIRWPPPQHYLVDRHGRGSALDNDADDMPGFPGPQRLSQATALDVVPPQGSKDDLWGRSCVGRRLVIWRGVNVTHGSYDGVGYWAPLRHQDL